ncbi:MAG TPA: HPF/RaiA family ribosome-associated protein [Candidatus Pacebacteria bacterium]|nr:HPF/RaiA family ribosome-associated protein [Candidatus Paceibacterota bacterium]HIP33533.1 HPF/RaiA family ribosome-associated protein [Bacteroidia bacterium]
MKIEIYAKDVEMTSKLEEYVEKKISSFDKILGGGDDERKCVFRIGKNTNAHTHGRIFFADVRVETPNKAYGAKIKGDTEYEVVDKVKDEILKKIRRHKNKENSLLKRGGRKIKELLRLG